MSSISSGPCACRRHNGCHSPERSVSGRNSKPFVTLQHAPLSAAVGSPSDLQRGACCVIASDACKQHGPACTARYREDDTADALAAT